MLSYQRNAATLATEVLKSSGASLRLKEEGYTRVDPTWVAAQAGVVVMRRPLDKLLGAFIRSESSGIILNSKRPTGQTHLTCAHELGHFFLGHETTADQRIQYGKDDAKFELEADWFAYCLLTSRPTVALALRRKGWSHHAVKDPQKLYQLSLRVGVSFAAMAWSMVRLGLWRRSDAEQAVAIEPAEIKRSILAKGTFDSRTDVWVLDDGDRDLILEPSEGDHVVVQLPNHASAGYRWSLDDAQSEGFKIAPLSTSSSTETSIENAPRTAHLVSGPSHQAALSGNLVPLSIQEKRPWKTNSQDVETYYASIGYESSDEGLALASRQRLLDGHEAT